MPFTADECTDKSWQLVSSRDTVQSAITKTKTASTSNPTNASFTYVFASHPQWYIESCSDRDDLFDYPFARNVHSRNGTASSESSSLIRSWSRLTFDLSTERLLLVNFTIKIITDASVIYTAMTAICSAIPLSTSTLTFLETCKVLTAFTRHLWWAVRSLKWRKRYLRALSERKSTRKASYGSRNGVFDEDMSPRSSNASSIYHFLLLMKL